MSDILRTAEKVLENGFNVSTGYGFGIRVCVILFKIITERLELIGSGNHCVIPLCIKHRTSKEGISSTFVQTTFSLRLLRKIGSGKIEISLNEVPSLRFCRKSLVLHDGFHILVINNDFLIAFYKVEIDIGPHKTDFRLKTGFVCIGHLSIFLQIAESLVDVGNLAVTGAPIAHIGVDIAGLDGVVLSVGELARDEGQRVVVVGAVFHHIGQRLGETHHALICHNAVYISIE